MTTTPYTEYSHCKEESLVQLPSHWDAVRVRFLLRDGAEGIKIGPFGSALKLEDMVEEGFKVYGQENVINNNFDLGRRYISPEKFSSMEVYKVSSNDVLITMMGTSGKCRIVPPAIQEGIIDSHLLRMRTNDLVEPKFFETLLNETAPIEYQISIGGKGSIMHGLNSGIVKDLVLPVPPKPEQTAIANFLDRETAKIDTLIDKQEQLIKLLEEKRQAVISHAVTKGLNPDVRMKDSGVEWLGDVPEHWGVKQVRHLVKTAGGGTPSKEREDFWNGEIPWISPKDMKRDYLDSSEDAITSEAVANSSVKLLPSGCLLIVVRGMILAHSVPVGIAKRGFTINQDMKALMPYRFTTSDYLLYLFKGLRDRLLELVEDSAHGTKKLGTEMFQRLPIPIPPMSEQGAILEDILRRVGRIDSLVDEANRARSLLSERRTALISAAVTGKIDVREAV